MNPQSLNPYTYCLNNPLKYIDPDGRESIMGWAQEYIRDPLLAPIPIDTSTYRSTLLSIHRVENRMYELKTRISGGKYEYHKQQYEYWTRKTFRGIDPNTWPTWQQDAMLLPVPPFNLSGFLWAYEFYMGKLSWNTWNAAYHINEQVRFGEYEERYLELLELLEELRKKYNSFDDKSDDRNNNRGGSGSLPSGDGNHDRIPI